MAPYDFYLFRSMAHGLSKRRFHKYDEVGKWVDEWILSKEEEFFYHGIHKLPEIWTNILANDGKYVQ